MNNYLTEPVQIEKLIPGGMGIGTLASGQKLMLWNALPGEIVTRSRITKKKSSYLEGVAEQISNPATCRIAPRDDCYLATSPWQIIDYQTELREKACLLQEIFRQHKLQIALPNDIQVATDGQEYYYRNKMEYSLYYSHEDHQIYPAFRARGSHRKIICERSSLERPEIWQYAQKVIADLNNTGAEARDYQSLLLRANQSGEVSGGLYQNHHPHPVFPLLSDTILGRTYSYSPNGFFQINLPVYEMALEEIRHHITTGKVLDLYAGVGTIGLSVAREQQLTLVESDGSAYRELAHNCQTSGTNATAIHTRSEYALEYITPDQTVILDPPRAGCSPELIERLLLVMPPVIIYLSCNPATQARDVKMLETQYTVTLVQPYNFFPRTPHLENLIVMARR